MVPMKYKGLGFERYDSDAYNKEAVATMKGLVAETEKGAFVYGPPGTGKSMLVAVFAKYPGATERERVEAYVKAQGFTDADIAKFRTIMLEPR